MILVLCPLKSLDNVTLRDIDDQRTAKKKTLGPADISILKY